MGDFIIPDWPAPERVKAMTTTRAFGNLAGHVGDDPEMLATRREVLRRRLPADPLWLTQVHGTTCVAVEGSFAGVEADASFARSPGHVCAVLTADCLPILLCDDAGSMVAAIHAGWRGLAAGVVEATVHAMATPGDRLLAWLGPGIGPATYEVGRDVLLAFSGTEGALKAFNEKDNGKWQCDLYAIARHRLASVGVTRVWGGPHCTFTDNKLFFSHRRDGVTGRMASLIWIV